MSLDVNTDEAFASFLPGRPQEDDKSLIVTFFTDKKLLGEKSRAAGRPIYEDREYVRIQIKGQDKQVVVEEVKQSHKEKYPFAYHAFVSKKPAPVIGTPIEQLNGVGPSQAHNLRGLNLRTVEDLAGVTDENTLSAIGMGARDLVKKAKAWIDGQSTKSVDLEQQLAAEREARAEEKKRNDALEARLAVLEKKPKTKKKAAPKRQPQGAAPAPA